MKKIFLMAAAAVAVMFTSCSKEDTNNGGSNPEEIKGSTYATFTFRGATTRAVETDATFDEAKESKLGDILFLIFDAGSGAVEVREEVGTSVTSVTTLIKAGNKKIYALANLTANMKTALADFTIGGTKTHSDLLALTYDAGTPGTFALTDPAITAIVGTYKLDPLRTYLDGTSGLPMSTSSEKTYTLEAGVSQAASSAGAAADVTSNATNSFKLMADYMLAKVGVVMATNVPVSGGKITGTPKFVVRNLAKHTTLVQNKPSGIVKSYYHDMSFANYAAYNAHFDYESAMTNGVEVSANVAALTTPGKYIYAAENTNATLTVGQATYIALEAIYTPDVVVTSITPSTLNGQTATSAASPYTPGGSYVMLTKEVACAKGTLQAGTYYNEIATLENAILQAQFGVDWGTTGYKLGDLPASVKYYYATYTNSKSYYRINIGETANGKTTYGVWRGRNYIVTVNKITGPGFSTEEGLITGKNGGNDEKPTVDPTDPVETETAVSVTIEAKKWIKADQSVDL